MTSEANPAASSDLALPLPAQEPPTVVRSAEPVAEAAAQVARALERMSGTSPRLAVSGGSALPALGVLRARLPRELWGELRLTWVDERCVATDNEHSNRGLALRAGHLDPRHPPLRELPLFLDGETQEQACRRVVTDLKPWFGDQLDVLLFGMGEDGHIASLFPGRPELFARDRVLPVTNSPKPPPERITLALPLLATAREAVLLAAGETKRGALERLIRRDPTLPASALTRLTIVTDLAL